MKERWTEMPIHEEEGQEDEGGEEEQGGRGGEGGDVIVRVRKACVQCQLVKRRCDGKEPCSRCLETNAGSGCRYRPRKPRRSSEQVRIEHQKALRHWVMELDMGKHHSNHEEKLRMPRTPSETKKNNSSAAAASDVVVADGKRSISSLCSSSANSSTNTSSMHVGGYERKDDVEPLAVTQGPDVFAPQVAATREQSFLANSHLFPEDVRQVLEMQIQIEKEQAQSCIGGSESGCSSGSSSGGGGGGGSSSGNSAGGGWRDLRIGGIMSMMSQIISSVRKFSIIGFAESALALIQDLVHRDPVLHQNLSDACHIVRSMNNQPCFISANRGRLVCCNEYFCAASGVPIHYAIRDQQTDAESSIPTADLPGNQARKINGLIHEDVAILSYFHPDSLPRGLSAAVRCFAYPQSGTVTVAPGGLRFRISPVRYEATASPICDSYGLPRGLLWVFIPPSE
eukprot:ANDGO_06505.mRNA.1 hypothetical protein